MTTPGVLARNEFLKTRKRPAFWVALGLFLLIDGLGFGGQLYSALTDPERSFSLPRAWNNILGESSILPLIFGSVALLLLIASEFSWRTARQNVIDGLTRGQWYWGKAVLVFAAVPLFVLAHVGLGAGLALVGTETGGDVLFAASHARALGGVLLSGWGLGALALLVGTVLRSTGGAMAVWFFYVVFGERLIAGIIGRAWPGAREALRYLPVRSIDGLRDPLLHDPAALAEAVERARAAGTAPPDPGDPLALAVAAVLWILVIVSAGYLAFRQRDL